MAWLLAALVIALAVIVALSLYGASEMISIPFLAVPYRPPDFGLAYEEISFPSHDGLKLTGWFLPAAGEARQGRPAKVPSPVTIVVLHGLGSNAGDMLQNSLGLAREGTWNLLFLNFRGHADSQGRFTSLGPLELKDLESALAYLKREKPDASRRLGIYGHSLGAAVAIVGPRVIRSLRRSSRKAPSRRRHGPSCIFPISFTGSPIFRSSGSAFF